MHRIRVLTEETINKIAAGEVIENPASVIKELAENGLDAGARNLTVEIKGGGFQLIKVSDDGLGMNSDDAVLCFERHATSKISHIDDLSSLDSMGFRGEALASIASVARIDLTTSLQEGQGTRVEIEAGKIRSVGPAPRQRGTTFEVRSLFYNTPARKKFQKNASSAAAEIHRLMITLALAHPEIGFEFISNDEQILKVPPALGAAFLEQLEQRIAALFQTSFLAAKLQLHGAENNYRLQGFLGTAGDHRINRTGQYLFVNRRPIFSPQVGYAIKEGYGERLDKDRYPVFVLHLEVPAHLLDVNVHPQKKEVRFQEGDFIRRFVKEQVQRIFSGSALPVDRKPVFENSFSPSVSWEAPLVFREGAFEAAPLLNENEQVIGLFEHYLLLDGSTVVGHQPGIVWIDLRKAEQQLIWHALNTPELETLAQGLLLPLGMELTSIEAQDLQQRQAELARCGFSVQLSGKQSVLIEAVPPFLEESDAIEAVRLILQSEDPFSKLSEKIARFAVRRKKRFMLQEALTLWRKFKQINSSEGITWMGMHDIESFFK